MSIDYTEFAFDAGYILMLVYHIIAVYWILEIIAAINKFIYSYTYCTKYYEN